MPWQRRQVDRVGLVRGIERLRPVDDERLGVRSFGARDERDAVLPGDRQARIAERLSVLGDIIHHQTDQVTMMPLFYQGQAAVLDRRASRA